MESQRISALTTQTSDSIPQGKCGKKKELDIIRDAIRDEKDYLPSRQADEFSLVATPAESKTLPREDRLVARGPTIELLVKDPSTSKYTHDEKKSTRCFASHRGHSNLTPASIAELEEDIRKKRLAAEKTFRRNQDLLSERRARERKLQQQAGVTAQDIARREFQLKQQRDRIIEKKNAERELRLNKGRKEIKDPTEGLQSSGLSKKKNTDTKALTASSMRSAQLESDERRSMIRVALARRMKQELLESEEERLRKMQSEQFTELDRKLRLVEQLRDENRMKELQLTNAIAAQQTQRFKNIQLSAAKLSNND